MKAPHLPANLSLSKPRPIFVKALLAFILIVIGDFVLPWLNLPSYLLWVIVAVYAVYVLASFAVGGSARDSSDVERIE